jgi:hypothetical protein
MEIKEIIFRYRNEFSAVLICENCRAEQNITVGYDDDYYNNVILNTKCLVCSLSKRDLNENSAKGRVRK